MQIGVIIFPGMDQMDFTGPFEVLARLPDAKIHVVWKDLVPVRDTCGLVLTPDTTLDDDLPLLDVLVVPGGTGQLPLMEDEVVLSWLRKQLPRARNILSVCTGALTLGAAGFLRGRRATTHWNSFHLLPYFGAIPEDARVVVDGNLISTAGVSAGIDGSLHLAAILGGQNVAQQIQLEMHYAPEPPFTAGDPKQAPESILGPTRKRADQITSARLDAAKRVAERLEIPTPQFQ